MGVADLKVSHNLSGLEALAFSGCRARNPVARIAEQNEFW